MKKQTVIVTKDENLNVTRQIISHDENLIIVAPRSVEPEKRSYFEDFSELSTAGKVVTTGILLVGLCIACATQRK